MRNDRLKSLKYAKWDASGITVIWSWKKLIMSGIKRCFLNLSKNSILLFDILDCQILILYSISWKFFDVNLNNYHFVLLINSWIWLKFPIRVRLFSQRFHIQRTWNLSYFLWISRMLYCSWFWSIINLSQRCDHN